LYIAWHAAYHPYVERSLAKAPSFIVNSFLATVVDLSAVGGVSYNGEAAYISSAAGVALAAILLAAACARCLQLHRVPKTTIYMGVGLLCVWVAVGLNEGKGRLPAQSRYQFANSLLLMLALAPLVPRFRLTPLRGAIVALLVGAVVVLNLGSYSHWEKVYRYQERVANAQLAAMQLARPAIANPRAVFTFRNKVGLYWPFTPKAYFAAIDAHGSPVNVVRDLELASQPPREQADLVLVLTEQILVPAHAQIGTIRPSAAPGFARLRAAGAGCAVIPAGAAAAGFEVLAPRGGLVIRPAAGPPVGVGVARFADPPAAIALAPVPGAGESERITGEDTSSVPWRFRLTGRQAVTVCSGTG
jgi:hypothetical protein